MASPVKPQAKRAKPVPAIFANPAAESTPFVSGPATFPDAAAPLAPVALPDHAPQTAAVVHAVVEPAIAAVADRVAEQAPAPTAAPADAAPPAVDDATDPVDASPASAVADAEPPIERNEGTVTAPSHDIVSALPKGPTTMATAFDTTKAQDMMGEISTRAKGAMEKNVKFAEDMTEFTKGNVEAIVASGRVAAKGMEAMAHDAAETAKTSFEQAQTAMKSFTQVKSPTELFQLQSDYAKTAFDQLVANAAKTSEQMMKYMGDVAQPLSNRYALASEKVKSAAF